MEANVASLKRVLISNRGEIVEIAPAAGRPTAAENPGQWDRGVSIRQLRQRWHRGVPRLTGNRRALLHRRQRADPGGALRTDRLESTISSLRRNP